jgi:hypothetical protein
LTAAKRIRRTPEEARRLILDAAEACMAKAGPAGLRLQEVAEAAGVSHPTILHRRPDPGRSPAQPQPAAGDPDRGHD